MILHDFPDLKWLQKQAEQRFANQQTWSSGKLSEKGWPSVILNTVTRETYRPDINGPVSLFLNLKGQSRCRLHGQTTTVQEGTYFMTNSADRYTLEIESTEPVETFNLHFGDRFTREYFQFRTSGDSTFEGLLDQDTGEFRFFSNRNLLSEKMNKALNPLIARRYEDQSNLWMEEQLITVLDALTDEHTELLESANRIPAARKTTRREIMQRVLRAKDLLHDRFLENPTLEEIGTIVGLSRFHLLRSFKEAIGQTPHQYLMNLRMEKATLELCRTDEPIADIAFRCGFQNVSSFNRSFRQRYGMPPKEYRRRTIPPKLIVSRFLVEA